MLSKGYNDIRAEILHEGGDDAVCSFTRDNIKKTQGQEDWIKKLKMSNSSKNIWQLQMLQKNHSS